MSATLWRIWDTGNRKALLLLGGLALMAACGAGSTVLSTAHETASAPRLLVPHDHGPSPRDPGGVGVDAIVRWPECREIPVDLLGDDPRQQGLLDEALWRVNDATGLRLVRGVTIDALAEPDRGRIAVGFVPLEHHMFDGHQEAVGVAHVWTIDDAIVAAAVAVAVNAPLEAGFGPGITEGNVLLHELAHAVGVGHVDDPTSILAPVVSEDHPDGYGGVVDAALEAAGIACTGEATAEGALLPGDRLP